MTWPNFIDVSSIPFGNWIGSIPIYFLTSNSTKLRKTDIELEITLCAVENNHTGIVKIIFKNTSLGLFQEILAYNNKRILYFNKLNLSQIISNVTLIEFIVNGTIEFIEDNRLRLNITSSGDINNNIGVSVAAQSIFNPFVDI